MLAAASDSIPFLCDRQVLRFFDQVSQFIKLFRTVVAGSGDADIVSGRLLQRAVPDELFTQFYKKECCKKFQKKPHWVAFWIQYCTAIALY